MNRVFLDTNVVVYAISVGSAKKPIAARLMASGFIGAVQVLNEMANVARKKLSMGWDEVQAASNLVVQSAKEIVPTKQEDHELSLMLAQRYQLAIYDALMLAIALRAGCETFYTEDMHPGLVIDNRLMITNPFA